MQYIKKKKKKKGGGALENTCANIKSHDSGGFSFLKNRLLTMAASRKIHISS